MEICKIIRIFFVVIFFTISSSVKSENNLLDRKVSVVDLILLKYEIFLTKNFNRLYKGGGMPNSIILYQYVDATVKYTKGGHQIFWIWSRTNRRGSSHFAEDAQNIKCEAFQFVFWIAM